LLSSSTVFQSAAAPGFDIIKYEHSSKPSTLWQSETDFNAAIYFSPWPGILLCSYTGDNKPYTFYWVGKTKMKNHMALVEILTATVKDPFGT
jgi:hypothetical protein